MSNLTKALAMDCEMVGAGNQGSISMAARVSLVDEKGDCVYDTYIKPTKKVTDYRTAVSGIKPEHLAQGKPFYEVKQKVARYIKGRILVGHSVDKDLRVLNLHHPKKHTRDTAKYHHFYQPGKRMPSLKYLAKKHLGLTIQNGSHDSVQDAAATMQLFKQVEDDWEKWLSQPELEIEEYYDYC